VVVKFNYDFPKAYKLVQHDISLTCKYQGPHSPVKLPPFSKCVLSTFNNHGSHVIPKVCVCRIDHLL